MAAQKNYTYSTPMGVPGGKVDIAFDVVKTRMNEAEDGVLKFGMAAAVGTTPGTTVTVPSADTTAEKIEGVVICHPNTEQDMKGTVVVKKNVSVGVMSKGHIWARTATDVTPEYGETAYVVISGDDAGSFTNVADGALDIGAKFGKYAEDGIAVIELN